MRAKFKYLMLLIGLIILGILLKNTDFETWQNIILKASLPLVILAALSWAGVSLLATYRFKGFLHTDMPFLRLLGLYNYGFLFNLASGVSIAGAGAKIGLLKMEKLPVSKSSAAISLEIIYTMITASVISIISLFLYANLLFNYIHNLLTFQNILLVLLLATILIVIAYLLRHKQFMYKYKLNLINSFTERNAVKNILITLIIRILESLSVFFLFKSVGCTISFGLILFGMNLSLVLSTFTFIPGGIGIREGIQASVYSLSAIPFSLAFSLSIVSRIITIFVSIVLIFIATLTDFTIRHSRCHAHFPFPPSVHQR